MRDILCGVPQGSVLGPLLFLIYVNDLTKLDIQGKFTLFADDTTILWHEHNKDLLQQKIVSDLPIIKQWCDVNLHTFNVSKTNIIGFQCDLMDLHIENSTVGKQNEVKFLGLIIDKDLKFQSHVKEISKKVASGCYAVRIVAREIGSDAAKMVYHALVESHLRYGISYWGSSAQCLLKPLFVLQKRALRYICGSDFRQSCRPLFASKKILTITSIFILETVATIYKHRFQPNDHQSPYLTRQSDNLILPIPSSTRTKNSIIYQGKKMFNHLPRHIRSMEGIKQFKGAVKRLLTDRVYYTLNEFYTDRF